MVYTGLQPGLTPARKVGSSPDNGALSPYTIASGYATGIGRGDPVKLHTDGTLVVATNGADAIGVFDSVKYKATGGSIVFDHKWTAAATGTDIEALVYDGPFNTFTVKGDTATYTTQPGDIFALSSIGSPNAYTGRSSAVALVATDVVGDVDIFGDCQ